MQLTDSDRIRSITSEWGGERDTPGRPLVPDDILERMKAVTTEEAWGVLRSHGYHHNFVGGFIDLHPDQVMVGRAITCTTLAVCLGLLVVGGSALLLLLHAPRASDIDQAPGSHDLASRPDPIG